MNYPVKLKLLSVLQIVCMATAILLVSVFSNKARAATKTSAATGNWSAPATWSPPGVPAIGDNVIIHGGHTITVDGSYSCNNFYLGDATASNTTLTVNAGSDLTINGDLQVNPSNKANTYTLNANAGAINVAGTFSYWSTTGTNTLRTAAGTLNFTPAISISNANQNITFTGAGTINFYNSFTDSYNKLVTFASCVVNFFNDYTVNTTAASWAAKGTAVFKRSGRYITPNSNLTLFNVQFDSTTTLSSSAGTVIVGGNLTLSAGSTFIANKDFEVDGNWTNNGGALNGGNNTVILNGVTKTIGGTAATTFPNGQIGATAVAVSYTMNTNCSFNNLTFNSSTTARTLTISAGDTLTVNGDLTINQPGAAVTNQLAVNTGVCSVAGNLVFAGIDNTASRIGKVAVTTGSFSLNGTVTWMNNTAVATEVITVSTGTISFGSSIAMGSASGTLSVTGAGNIYFNGSTAPSFDFGGATAPSFTTVAGCNLYFNKGLTNNTNALVLNATSNAYLTGNGAITSNAGITFGHLTINSAANDTIAAAAGALVVAGNLLLNANAALVLNKDFEVDGNWTNNGGALNGGNNTVILNGVTKTIGGTAATTFPNGQIGATAVAVSYTMNTNCSFNNLTFNSSTTARTLTISAGDTLTVNGDLTINQPGAAVTNQLAVNTGVCTVAGNLVFAGTVNTATWIGKVAVTTGSFTLNGTVTWMNNTAVATEVITVSTGTISFGSSIAMGSASGTLSVTGAGNIYFNGSTAPSFDFGGATAPSFTTVAGCNLYFNKGLTNNTNALVLNATSNAYLTGNGAITSNAGITFGHLTINSAANDTIAAAAGALVVAGNLLLASNSTFVANQNFDINGNWTNNGGTFIPNTSTVSFKSTTAAQSIQGTNTNETFYNIIIAKTAQSLTIAGSISTITINGNVTLTSGTLNAGTSSPTIYIASGNWTNNGGTFTPQGSTVVFNSNAAQAINGTAASQTFNSLTVNKSGATLSIAGSTTALTLNSNLTISAGTFDKGTATTINAKGDWINNGGNFTYGTGTVSFNGTVAQAIKGSATTQTFYNLTVNKATDTLSISGSTGTVTVNNTLTFTSGLIKTGTNKISIPTTATVSGAGAGKYIYGNAEMFIPNVAAPSKTFAIGDATTYAPVTVLFAGTASGSGSVTARTDAGDDADINNSGINSAKSVNRTWTLTNNGVGGYTSYSPTYTFTAGDIDAGATTANFEVRRLTSGTWSTTTAGVRTATTTQCTGQTQWGKAQVGEKNTISVTTHPSDATGTNGYGVSFTSTSTSVPTPTVKWQRDPNTGSFTDITSGMDGSVYSNFTTTTLVISDVTGLNNYKYRAVFTNINGSATSNQAILTTTSSPTITGTTSNARCDSGTITLGATANIGTINWYAAATGGASLATGTSFTTPVLYSTTTYYVDATNLGITSPVRTAVIATINTTPVITGTTPDSRCDAGVVVLGATSSAGTINWYAASSGGASLGTGTSYATPSISSTTTYYIDATVNGCTTASRTAVAATVTSTPTITGTTPAARCDSGTVALGATASAGTINWYAAAIGGASLATGTNYTTPSIASDTTYYVDATSAGCTTGSRTAVLATVNTTPVITSITSASRCDAGTLALGAASSAGTINWYLASTGGVSLGTGTSYTTPSISANTAYYVDATAAGCTTGSRTAVLATVNTTPTIISTTPAARCDSGTVTLSAASSAGTIKWYAASSGGTSLATATSYTTPGISSTTNYYVAASANGCTTGSRTQVTATVTSTPTITGTTPAFRCDSGTVALAATSSSGTINWYSASSGGVSLATGTSYTTPGILSTTTYYIDATDAGCTSPSRLAIKATIDTTPVASIIYQSCAGTDGNTTIKIGQIYGTSPFTYSIDNTIYHSYDTVHIANSSNQNYYVKDVYGCTSATINYTATAQEPSRIVASGSNASCGCASAAEGRDLYLTSASGDLIAVINDKGHDLGTITASVYAKTSPVLISNNQGGHDAALGRNFVLDFNGTGLTPAVEVKFPFTNTELGALITQAANTPIMSDDINSVADLGSTQYEGPDEDDTYNTSGATMLLYHNQLGNGSILGGHYITVGLSANGEHWLHGNNQNGSPLPVKLVSFDAVADQTMETVETKWTTALEINNAYFTVERSNDGINFNEVGRVNGAGNYTGTLNYTFHDANPLTGLSYYRLKQVDFDGAFEYSSIVSVVLGQQSSFQMFPNPTTDKVTIDIANLSNEINLSIYDLSGNEVFRKAYTADSSEKNNRITLNAKDLLPAGMYMISITANGTELKKKLILN